MQRTNSCVHRDSKRRRGAAIAEAAIVLPMFFMVIVGIVEFGRAMMVGQIITTASREGARRAAFHGSTNASVATHVQSFLSEAINVPTGDITVDITITPHPPSDTTGDEVSDAEKYDLVKVKVSVPYQKVSFVNNQWLNGTTLSGQTSMSHE